MTQISNQLTFEDAAKRIYDLTLFSRKDEGEVMLSYLEELGELCQEVKIELKVAGTEHKNPGVDGIFGECADVWICAMSHISVVEQRVPIVWMPGNITYTLNQFKQCITNNSVDTQSMAIWIMRVAVGQGYSLDSFCNKVHEKLDKWERNVKMNG